MINHQLVKSILGEISNVKRACLFNLLLNQTIYLIIKDTFSISIFHCL